MNYGELLDASYDPLKDKVYEMFTEYFENPTMTKIKDVSNFSMYVAKMHCLLSTSYRYIMIFVPIDKMPLGNTDTLSEFKWEFLQTRTLTDNHNLQPQRYASRRFAPLMKTITLTDKQSNGYLYSVDEYPLSVTLLPKTGGQMDYQNTGNIVIALETYNTIIGWV